MNFLKKFRCLRFGVTALLLGISTAATTSADANSQLSIIEGYAKESKQHDPKFTAFSAERGRLLFSVRHATGKPETPSCTSCHTKSPLSVGSTRAGKEIAPMAISKTPDRYTDIKKVEKWFRRNCKSVLGRPCTPLEKGDFLAFMMNQ